MTALQTDRERSIIIVRSPQVRDRAGIFPPLNWGKGVKAFQAFFPLKNGGFRDDFQVFVQQGVVP